MGYEEGGQLTEAVRRKPYSVVLFDEIEKAHYDVFNILLQILEDGRITDSQGRVVSFKNTIIIMTSNLASHLILEHKGAVDEVRDEVTDELKRHFRPEFLNRVDEVLIFRQLNKSDMLSIMDIQLERFRKRLAEHDVKISLSDAAKSYIVEKGFDPAYGARPLKRAVIRELETPVSRLLIEGSLQDGGELQVDVNEEGLNFNCLPPENKE